MVLKQKMLILKNFHKNMKKLKVHRKSQIKYNRKFRYLQENDSIVDLLKAIEIVKSTDSTKKDITSTIEEAPEADEEVILIVLIQVKNTREEEDNARDVDEKRIGNMKDKGEEIEKEEEGENWRGQGQNQVGLNLTKKRNQGIRKLKVKMK